MEYAEGIWRKCLSGRVSWIGLIICWFVLQECEERALSDPRSLNSSSSGGVLRSRLVGSPRCV